MSVTGFMSLPWLGVSGIGIGDQGRRGCLSWASGKCGARDANQSTGDGAGGERVADTGCVKFRIPRGKYLGEVGVPQIASEVHQTRKESMRFFHAYFFYPVL